MAPSRDSQKTIAATQLTAGRTYRVMKEFTDYDGIIHKVGDTWKYMSHNFLPYDDGLTLCVERDGQSHVFRLQWRNETQGHIVSFFSDYVTEV